MRRPRLSLRSLRRRERLRGKMRVHKRPKQRLRVLRSRHLLKTKPRWRKILPIRMAHPRGLKERKLTKLHLPSKNWRQQ